MYWLINGPPESVEWLLAGAEGRDRIRLVPDSKKAFLAYATARYVFFTHGLYGRLRRRGAAPSSTWHGDGRR